MKKFFAYSFYAVLLTAMGCDDGSIIGNDLLENEAIELAYDDNFELEGRTVRGDSIATFRSISPSRTILLGQVDDPVFGKYSSDIYTGFIFGSASPDFTNSVLDSLVLYLDYDSLGFYGDSEARHNIEVFRVTEDFLTRDTIYSDESFMTSITPLGSRSLVPNPQADSIRWQVRDTEVDSFVYLTPRINIRLDDAFGQEILEDTFAVKSDELLIETFKGLYIKSTVDGSSMIGLNFFKEGSISGLVAKMGLYYTQTDDEGVATKRTYTYLVRNEVASNFVMDNSGSTVGNSLNSYSDGEEFIYAQGMAGVNGEIELPDLSALDGNIINSAQLVLTVSEDDALHFTDDYPINASFLLSKYNDEGERVLIDDLTKDDVTITNGLTLLGGVPELVEVDGEMVTTVTFTITDFVSNSIKAIKEGGPVNPKLVISPVGRGETPRRTVFYGSKHPTYPAKLKIAYTII